MHSFGLSDKPSTTIRDKRPTTREDARMSKSEPEVRHVDPIVLRDLQSKFANVSCPVHNVTPKFDVAGDGSIVETICCEVLLRIVRELQEKDDGEGAVD
jgi:hypothetical protein